MIKEALEYIVGVCQAASQPDQIEINGRKYLFQPHSDKWDEIRGELDVYPEFFDERGNPLRLGTIDALISFIKDHEKGRWQVVVAPSGVRAYFGPDEAVCRDDMKDQIHMVCVPFNFGYEKHEFRFVGFQDWLDQHHERIKEYDELAKAVKEMKSVDMSSVSFKETGPIISMAVAASKGCEGNQFPIPKEIQVTLPTGTREFLIPNIYLLRIALHSQDMVFTLTKKENDGSWDELVALSFEKLMRANLNNALILEGA